MKPPEQIGAFFDLDGTLLALPSLEGRFIRYLQERDEIRTQNVAHWVAESAKALLNGWRYAVFANKHYLAGIHESFVAEWANTITQSKPGLLPWFAEGIDHVRRHVECGHRVVLVTGTLAPLARAIAGHLPRGVEVRATEVEIRDGCFTGRISGTYLGFEEKARVIRRQAGRSDLDLSNSFAYGNEMSDAAMLEVVGHPVAVNASWRLDRRARRRGWTVLRWSGSHEEKKRTIDATLARRVVR
jgi:HAD superfamily hydrolase (TIGR01490 family)